MSSSPYKPEDADDVVERTIEGMVGCELLTPEQAERKIVSRQLMRVPYSYPVPTLGRDAALAVIQPWLMEHDIYSRGRFGAWRYEIGNTDHSVMMGVEVADHLMSGAGRDHLGPAAGRRGQSSDRLTAPAAAQLGQAPGRCSPLMGSYPAHWVPGGIVHVDRVLP